MDQHDDGARLAAGDAQQLPGRTTPTWEVEMLLSGATVFALIQLAGALPGWGVYLLPRLADQWLELARLVLLYGHSAVMLLCLAFLLHLLLRAYWVALVGMHSVFPGALKLDRLRAGPIAKSLLTERWEDMDAAIERADNRATVVFGLGIGLTLVLVLVTVSALLLFLASLGIAAAVGIPQHTTNLMLALFGLWLGPQLAAGYVDRKLGHRLRKDGFAYRGLHRLLRIYSWTGTSRESSPLVTLYSSHVGETRSTWVVLVVMLLVVVLSLLGAAVSDQDLGPGNYARFPEGQGDVSRAVRHPHYASRHEAGETPRLPFVPDLVARGRYLPLVVPYVPTLHEHLLANCTLPPRGDDAAVRETRHVAALDCLAAGFRLQLDGQPLPVPAEAYTDAARDLRGLLYMIPTAGLAPGRHELRVTLTPAEPPEEGEAAPSWRIPFWR